MLLEVCIATVEDAITAQLAGAHRLEINSDLSTGGLTPSCGLHQTVRRSVSLPIISMIRPRTGGFCYNEAEFEAMRIDVESAVNCGSNGIAFGILQVDGTIDVARCRELRNMVGEREAVFHRAFDLVANPFIALEQLIDLGITRILTSGQRQTALQGVKLIRELIERSRDRIEILPGAGINRSNVAEIVRETGCRQVHGSFRGSKVDGSLMGPLAAGFGNVAAGLPVQHTTDFEEVVAVRRLLVEMESSKLP